MKTLFAFFITAAVLGATAVAAQDVLIRGAQVHTLTSQGKLDSADVLVRAGKIVAVGTGLAIPAGARVVDAKGRPLTPGFFGGLSQIGLTEVGMVSPTNDSEISISTPSLRERWRPEFDVIPAFNPRSTLLPVARMEGLTWTVVTPSSSGALISGQGAAITLDGRFDAELPGSRTLFVEWGGSGKGTAGGSRAAEFMLFDQVVREVRASAPNEEIALLYPAGREVLVRYLAGGRVIFTADRAADIRQVVAYARRQGMKPVILGGCEAWVVADELARAGVPVILNSLENLPNSFDRLGARLDNAALLNKAGVRIVFSEGGSHNARKIRQLAGNAVAHGLPWDVALASMTSTPAEVFGLGVSRGRIAAGQVADLVLWSADPLDVTSLPDGVWISGQEMPLRSRQTELRDRYLERLKAGHAR